MWPTRPLTLRRHALVLAAAFAAAYAPDVGLGFVKDDFRWIVESRAAFPDLWRPFVETTGFFRPVVSLSFALNYGLFGAEPLGYGLTNLALAIAAAVLVGCLARALRLPAGACVLAAAAWIFNFHGINMAILWISGRTALLLVVFSLLSAYAAARGRIVWSAALCFAALLSKEEAVLLPLPLLLIIWMRAEDATRRGTQSAVAAMALAVIETAYLWMRMQSDAMTPADAPGYYRFTFAPAAIAVNAAQYFDRGATFCAAIAVVAALLVRAVPRLTKEEAAVVKLGALWFAAGYGVTVFLPVRSSLYAIFPSIGAALALGSFGAALYRRASPTQAVALSIAAAVIPVLLIPVYRSRNERWTELASLATTVTDRLQPALAASPPAPTLLLIDDRSHRANLANAFGSHLPQAILLISGTTPHVFIVPPLPDDGAPGEPVPDGAMLAFELRERARLEPVDPAPFAGRPASRLQ